ncbi:hypothetical protein [Kushneria phosphatilytica]|uniref:Uncharacterized protein n=1 Tax=Kushneria phosphatilytica TaxID=657387 RepID=A0A1S1NVM6_9GAMM|nr:hypothetical protein [Kushneria phosphatilytica]OHV11180.1 hypothetical protein BH688_07590 [Kushneria phosphatilytica]QEL12251.1 hypothetical protein FY550_14640 [Kushneria phosphatilytica]
MSVQAPTTPGRVSNSPRGCNAPVIGLALKPDEREEVKAIAGLEMRSLSATARVLLLKGMAAYRAEQTDA